MQGRRLIEGQAVQLLGGPLFGHMGSLHMPGLVRLSRRLTIPFPKHFVPSSSIYVIIPHG